MKKIQIGVGLVVLVGLIAGSIAFINGGDAKSNKSSVPYKTSVRLKWLDQAQFSGLYWAKDQGLYAKKNVNVSLAPGGPDVSPIQTVANGSNDFGIIGADQILLAREKGVPVVALAVIYQDTSVAVATLKSSGITQAKDLEGKKVAVAYGRDEEVVYKAMLKNAKVDRSSIKESPLNFSISQIATGETDGQIVYENNEPVSLKQQGYDVNLIKPRDYGVNFYADTLFTTEKMIKEHPDVVRSVVTATLEGWKQSFKNVDKAAGIIKKQNPSLDLQGQKQSLTLLKPLILRDGKVGQSSPKKWKAMEDILIEQSVMKKRVELDKAYTQDFLK